VCGLVTAGVCSSQFAGTLALGLGNKRLSRWRWLDSKACVFLLELAVSMCVCVLCSDETSTYHQYNG